MQKGLRQLQIYLAKYGFSKGKIFNLLLYYIKGVLAFPWMIIQSLLSDPKISKVKLNSTPIFIIGHYRSGTTYLHRILSILDQCAYPDMKDQFFPNSPRSIINFLTPLLKVIVKWFNIPHILFNKYQLNIEEPVEEEMCLISNFVKDAPYWGYIFPLQALSFLNNQSDAHWQEYLHLLKKIITRNPHKFLLLKNPTNTARITQILKVFPNAKFIFLYRNPYRVFLSMQEMWQSKIEKYYSLQEINNKQRQGIIFEHYCYLLDAYFEQKDSIPSNQLIEISYEELLANSKDIVSHIINFLNIKLGEKEWEKLNRKITDEGNYHPTHHQVFENTKKLVYKKWGKYIDHLGYTSG